MAVRKGVSTQSDAGLGVHAARRKPGRALRAGQSLRDDGLPRQWISRLAGALGDLEDRSALNQNPLARLAYVERLAAEKYSFQILPRGLALRRILLDCVDRVCAQLASESGSAKACEYLRLRTDGHTCQDISQRLGLSREHVSRTVRKKALEILAEEFMAVTRERR